MTDLDGIPNDTTSFSSGSTVTGAFAQIPGRLGFPRS